MDPSQTTNQTAAKEGVPKETKATSKNEASTTNLPLRTAADCTGSGSGSPRKASNPGGILWFWQCCECRWYTHPHQKECWYCGHVMCSMCRLCRDSIGNA